LNQNIDWEWRDELDKLTREAGRDWVEPYENWLKNSRDRGTKPNNKSPFEALVRTPRRHFEYEKNTSHAAHILSARPTTIQTQVEEAVTPQELSKNSTDRKIKERGLEQITATLKRCIISGNYGCPATQNPAGRRKSI